MQRVYQARRVLYTDRADVERQRLADELEDVEQRVGMTTLRGMGRDEKKRCLDLVSEAGEVFRQKVDSGEGFAPGKPGKRAVQDDESEGDYAEQAQNVVLKTQIAREIAVLNATCRGEANNPETRKIMQELSDAAGLLQSAGVSRDDP